MSENNNRKKLAVGVFIFVGLLILVIGVVVIGGQHKAFVKSIRLSIVFDDVQGLQAGNNVWLSGMKVGTVKKVAFYGRSQVLVELDVERQAQPHIRKDTKARITTDGLVGNKIVVLSGGSDSAAAVADNDRLESEHLEGLQEMMGTLQASNGNLLAITADLKAISEKLKAGQGTLGELLNDPSFCGRTSGIDRQPESGIAGQRADDGQPGGVLRAIATAGWSCRWTDHRYNGIPAVTGCRGPTQPGGCLRFGIQRVTADGGKGVE